MFSPKAILSGIAVIVACALIDPYLQAQGGCRDPDSQFMTFISTSYAVSGTVKHCELNLPCTTMRIIPVGDSASIFPPFSRGIILNSAYQTVYDVKVYDFSNVQDGTYISDCSVDTGDEGDASAATGTGSLLQGLITWTSNNAPFNCVPTSAFEGGNVDCNSAEVTQGLVINGVVVPIGNYPAGTSFPISGKVKDPGCALGVETFNGSLILQDSSVQGSGTDNITLSTTGMHVTGQATCTMLGQVNVFTTQYDLRVGGSTHKAKLDNGYSNSFKMGTGNLQLTAQLVQ